MLTPSPTAPSLCPRALVIRHSHCLKPSTGPDIRIRTSIHASICVRRHRIVRVAPGRIQKKLIVSAINLNLTTTSSYEHKMAETGSRVLKPSVRGLRSPPADRDAPPAHLALEAFLPVLHFLHEFLLFLGRRRLRRIFSIFPSVYRFTSTMRN